MHATQAAEHRSGSTWHHNEANPVHLSVEPQVAKLWTIDGAGLSGGLAHDLLDTLVLVTRSSRARTTLSGPVSISKTGP